MVVQWLKECPMDVQWMSNGCPMDVQWMSSMDVQCVSNGCLMDSLMVVPWTMGVQYISCKMGVMSSSMEVQWTSNGHPMKV